MLEPLLFGNTAEMEPNSVRNLVRLMVPNVMNRP